MTKKEQQRAEQLRQTLAPYVEELRELMKVHNAAAVRYCQGLNLWKLWQFGNTCENRNNYPTERIAQVEKLKETNPKAWAEKVKHAEHMKNRRGERSSLAAWNVKKYFEYFAEVVAHYFPDWREFTDRRGLEHIAEGLDFQNGTEWQRVAVRFSWDGAWWIVHAYTGNGWGEYSADYYQHNTTTQPATVPELPTRPQVVAFETYRGTVARLDIIKKKAEALKNESEKIAAAAGLLGFVNILSGLKFGK